MTPAQKQEVVEVLKAKFAQYSNFYITDTESLDAAQTSSLRRHCFDKQVEMTVAKNTLIKKALESLDSEKYAGIYDSLHNVTALMFSESPKEPALIISSFRKGGSDRPTLKAAYINGDIFVGDNQLVALTNIKTKNELIGEVLGLLQSPAKRVLAALLHNAEKGGGVPTAEAAATEAPAAEAPAAPEATAPEAPTADAPATDAPAAE
jgi:large subunit ribosomal protein L10